jgi:nucleoside-diphosphate-sugar epimerase
MAAAVGLQVVLGAGGGIGGAVVRELAGRGHRVRAVNRSGHLRVPPGVEVLGGDVTTAAGAKEACAGAAVVYHCAQPGYDRWPQEFPPMTRAILEGAAAADAKLVLADNLYMYGPVDRPMTEDLPYAATNPKGRVRAEMAELVLAAHQAGRLRTTIGRASDYFGPGGVMTVNGPAIFANALRGRTARWIGPLDVPHTVSYLPDIAVGLAVLGKHPEADGQAWHLPAADPVTGRQFLELVFAVLDRPARIAGVGRLTQRVLGLVNPALRELGETWYQRDRPFVLDAGRFQRTFGPRLATPLPEAVAETLDWFRRQGR